MASKSVEILEPITGKVAETSDPEHEIEIPKADLKPGKKAPKLKPSRFSRGIPMKTPRNIRIEMGRLYRLWWANEISDAEYKTALSSCRMLLDVVLAEIEQERAGLLNDEIKTGKFLGVKMIMANTSSERKKR